MRIIVLVILVGAACWAAGAFGTWKMNGARSTFTGGPQPKSLSIRIEPHAKGEVFTVDRIEADGRATSKTEIFGIWKSTSLPSTSSRVEVRMLAKTSRRLIVQFPD